MKESEGKKGRRERVMELEGRSRYKGVKLGKEGRKKGKDGRI